MTNSPLTVELKKWTSNQIDVYKILDLALSRGGGVAELFFEQVESSRISYEDSKVDKVIEGTDTGVALRIIRDHKTTLGYTTDLSESSLLELAKQLSQSLDGERTHSPQTQWTYPHQMNLEILNYDVKESPQEASIDTKVQYLKEIDEELRSKPIHLRQVTAFFLDSKRKTLTINSEGLVSPVSKTYLQVGVQAVGEKEGRVESTYITEGGFIGMELLKEHSPRSLAIKAANRLSVLLDSSPAPAGTMPVVISAEAGGTMVHEAVGHGLEADLACNGLSVYQGKVGKKVASDKVTVIDDGTLLQKRGSYAFDDEGTPSRRNVLIENGMLKGYMVDRVSAMKFDLMATGNGRRESFRHKPIVRMTNTLIAPGEDDPEQILKETDYGVFVKGMGGGQVNTVTGDFVFAVTEGYLIRNGEIAEPIRGATLVGNGPQVLMDVDRVGTDLGFVTGTCGKDGQGAPVTDAQPTLRIPRLTVGGEVPMETYFKK
tara:strand:- start:4652 stop:6112 length:1461 start_codon:yes stop_codon:yes gene_type:complete